MGKIKIKKEVDFTLFTCEGKVLTEDITKVLVSFYDDPTLNVVWDLSTSDVSNITSQNVESIVSITIARNLASKREGGKTAIVAPKDLDFGLSRMYQLMFSVELGNPKVHVFRTYEEAVDWIKEK